MAGERTQMFLAAKKALRRYPGGTDEEIAEAAGIPRVMVEEILREARKDLAADTMQTGHDNRTY